MVKKRKSTYGFKLFEVIIIVIITGILCSLASGFIFFKHYKNSTLASYDNLDNSAVNEFLEVYSSLIEKYYEDVDEDELVDSAINGMLDYLGDSYTEYLDKEKSNELIEKLVGEYEGIGIEIYQDKTIYSVFEDSPAFKAGLKVNDKIIKINNEDVSSKSNAEIADLIKNSNSEINITVLRDDNQITVSLKKDVLYIPSVLGKIVDNDKKIGYISITTFSNTTSKQFKKSLEQLEKEGINSLIIDVRNNTGGYLISAKEIASLFLEKGKIIYSLQTKNKTKNYKDNSFEKRDYKVIVLINEYSASTSEILTAALKDSYGAILVGKKSYGKGKVQQMLNLENGSMAKYTTAKWLTPKGICIDSKGIKPDYEVDLEINEAEEKIIDTQYNKAIEILSNN